MRCQQSEPPTTAPQPRHANTHEPPTFYLSSFFFFGSYIFLYFLCFFLSFLCGLCTNCRDYSQYLRNCQICPYIAKSELKRPHMCNFCNIYSNFCNAFTVQFIGLLARKCEKNGENASFQEILRACQFLQGRANCRYRLNI